MEVPLEEAVMTAMIIAQDGLDQVTVMVNMQVTCKLTARNPVGYVEAPLEVEVALTKVEAVLDGLDQDIAMVNMLST